jgi:hypothetical protein
VQPSIELRSLVDEETGEEIAAIKLESLFQSIRLRTRFERCRITPYELKIDSHLFISPRHYCVVAEGSPKNVERLTKRRTRMLLVGVRPEQTEERVAPMVSARLRDAEVSEEGNSLRLR